MIAVATPEGALVRLLPTGSGRIVLHSLFGFVDEASLPQRLNRRKLQGLRNQAARILCRFTLDESSGGFKPAAIDGCTLTQMAVNQWAITTPGGEFVLSEPAALRGVSVPSTPSKKDRTLQFAFLAALLSLSVFLIPSTPKEEAPPEIIEPLTVNIVPETQKEVSVPTPAQAQLAQLESKAQNKAAPGGAAVAQKLGFLSLLGKKDLTKAIGGAPTEIKDASPGAGAGGSQGSGGELLVGLGQGVKRTTVGNSGVSGLGGMGTGGKGGGAGGFGNSLVGSGGTGTGLNGIGEGKRLSAMALSNDIVLEGGLDRAVIQATIAKYISQVRACYEDGLRSNPGLAGQVTMNFEVGPKGNLNFAKVHRTTLGDAAVEGCISNRMMGWKFPEPLGGVNVKVVYPFLLRPTRS